MKITVVGTGFIGGVLGRALALNGQDVTFASRHPDDDDVAGTLAPAWPQWATAWPRHKSCC